MAVKIDFKLLQTSEKREIEFCAEGDFDPLSLAQALQFLNGPTPPVLPPTPEASHVARPALTAAPRVEADIEPFPFPTALRKSPTKSVKPEKSDGPYIQKGQRFGKLIALEEGRVSAGRTSVRCECGAEKTVLNTSLKNGLTKSCGSYACRANAKPKAKPDHSRIRPEDISDDELKMRVFES